MRNAYNALTEVPTWASQLIASVERVSMLLLIWIAAKMK